MIIDFSIPTITNNQSSFVGYWGRQLFIGSLSDSPIVNSLASTYVRLTFSAFQDYNEAAIHFRDYFNTSSAIKLSVYYKSISRYESCITNMHLAIRSFSRLRRHKDLPEKARKTINEPKPSFVNSRISDRILGLRNSIQHIEERLADGEFDKELPFFIKPTGDEIPYDDGINKNQTKLTIDRVKILDNEIYFHEIATWIEEMIQYVDKISGLMPSQVTSSGSASISSAG